jgi:hypothetical protein
VRALGEAAGAVQRAAGALLEFFMGGKLDQVTLVASAFLEMMAEVAVAHCLLDAAVVAAARQRDADDEHGEEADFYRGKVLAAKHFVNYVLPGVGTKLGAILGGDRSALDMPDGGFAPAR